MPNFRKPALDPTAIALLTLCCAFWGFQQILIKVAVVEVPPLWQAALRFGGATVLLIAWCAWRGVRLLQRDGTLLAGLAAGALFMAEFTCIYLGLQRTEASRLTVFLYTSPFIVAVLLPRIAPAERLRGRQWLGLAIAFAGVVLAFSEGFSGVRAEAGGRLHGDLLALAAGALWGATTLVIRGSALARAGAEKLLFYQVGFAAVAAPLVSLALGEHWSLRYSATAWSSIALQTVVGAFASYLAWMWMLTRYPATKMSSFTFLTPVFALVFGVLLLDEPLTTRLVLGLAGVAVGIVLVNRQPSVT